MVPGLVQPRLLFRVAAQKPEGTRQRSLQSGARRFVLPGSVGPSLLWSIGCVALVPGASDDRLPRRTAALARDSREQYESSTIECKSKSPRIPGRSLGIKRFSKGLQPPE